MSAQPIELPQIVFKPQPGPQTEFLRSRADIVFYGGSAGSGKSYALHLEAARSIPIKNATVAFFRRERTRITNPGGLWDESHKIFPHFNGQSNSQRLEWRFPSRASVSYCSIQYEQDVFKYHGSQIAVELFDEITEFSEAQFFYMLSRNRSDCGIRSYVRATCNPDSDSWVAKFISWWIGEDGFPIPGRSGVIRYFCRLNDAIFWGPTKEHLVKEHGVELIDCKSFTFIAATIEDNQILLQNDPGYVSNLRALGEVEKQRLLFGNWKIKAEGKIFRQEDFKVFVRPPANFTKMVITVDTAQKTKESNDYSVFQCWGKSDKGIYLLDQVRGKFQYPDLKIMFMSFMHKYPTANVFVEDSVSGTALIQDVTREVHRPIMPVIRSRDKYTRAYDVQGYVKAGYVFINCNSDYYTDFISEMTAFSSDGSHKHDDQVDCMMDAVDQLLIRAPMNPAQTKPSIQLNTRIT